MPGLFQAIKVGVSTTLGTFRRGTIDPAQVEGGAVIGQAPYYRLLWAFYDNSAYENVAQWASYKGQHRLYRQMRLLYNPTRRLVDFYATHIYPGVVATDPDTVPEGIDLAIPLADDTPQPVTDALGVFWEWSNWNAQKGVLCRYGAIAGNVLVEVVDDVERGKVYSNPIWPALVAYLDIDHGGVVRGYALQYTALDDDGIGYIYRKEVDERQFRFYRNGQEYDYGQGTAYPNPYGFVPAVWIKHRDLGGDYGAPAIFGSIGKVDELNSLSSHIHDQIHKVIGAPQVLWSDGGVQNMFGGKQQDKGAPTDPYDVKDLDREGILVLKGPEGGRVDSLAGSLQLAESLQHVQMLLTEIEQDHPEVTFYRELRAMSQVTGPAATRLMGDVVTTVNEAASNYDAGCARLFRMALAIAGWRAGLGAWGDLDAQQAVFQPFGLQSLTDGSLAFTILPRPLIQQSIIEKMQVEQMALSLEQQRQVVAAGPTTTVSERIEAQ